MLRGYLATSSWRRLAEKRTKFLRFLIWTLRFSVQTSQEEIPSKGVFLFLLLISCIRVVDGVSRWRLCLPCWANDSDFSRFVVFGIFIGVVDTFRRVNIKSTNHHQSASLRNLKFFINDSWHETGILTGFVDFSKYLQGLFYIWCSLTVRKGDQSQFIYRMFCFYMFVFSFFFVVKCFSPDTLQTSLAPPGACSLLLYHQGSLNLHDGLEEIRSSSGNHQRLLYVWWKPSL